MRAGRARVLLAVALLLLGGLGAEGRTRGKAASNELPMELYGGYLIVVEGSIGDLHGLKFLLDTGATTSAIDRKVVDKLGLLRRNGSLINIDKAVRVELCEVPQLAYGPEHVSNVRVIVADLQYLQGSGIRVDGVIGWDLLRRESFRLDFARKRIVFGATKQSGGRTVPMRSDALYLTVQVHLDGRDMRMIADTGMLGTMFYDGSLEGMHGSYTVKSQTMGRSLGGAVESRIAVVPRLQLGAQDLDRQVYLVHQSGSETLRGIAGYLGIASLEAKEVTFDFERNEMSWKK
jgi:hypothetical protein